jgi:hypothetical protein
MAPLINSEFGVQSMNPYKKKLNSIRTQYFLIKALENLLLFLASIIILFIASNFLIATFQNDFSFLKVIVIIFKSLSLLAILFCVLRTILNYHSLTFIARELSKEYPEHNEVLLSSLELEKNKSTRHPRFNQWANYSGEIINANINLANKLANQIKAKAVFNLKNLLQDTKIFAFVLGILLVSFLINKESFHTSYAAITDIEQFAPKYDTEIRVLPGDATLLKGSSQKIQIKNFYPELKYILNYGLNRRWKSVDLTKDNYTFFNIDEDFKYYVQSANGWIAKSDTFQIKVLEKPTIKELTIYYSFPAYSKLSNKVEKESSGNIIALKGTKIKFVLEVNNQLIDYRIIFSDGQTQKLKKLNDFKYSSTFTVKKSLSYHFLLEDILHNKNQPIERTIYAEADFPPKVEILSPAEDKILAQNLKEDIEFISSDDFGITELQIAFKKNNEEYTFRTIQKDIEVPNLKGTYTFNVSNQNLLPGDVICYYLLVYDNCTIPERQSALSKIYLLKFPSIEELYDEIQKQQEDKYQSLSKTLEETQKNKEKFDKLRRKFLKNEELDWQEKEDLKTVLGKQKELAQKAENISENYKKFIDQIEKNKAVSKETLEKLQQIQEIMKDIANPELNEVMKKLQEAIQNITPEQMKKALNNFKFSQEEFLKKLNETLNLLKSIQLEQNMQKCLQQAEELEKLQNELNKNTNESIEKNQDLSDLADEQKDISEKYGSLHKDLENLMKKLAEKGENQAAQELQKALEQMAKNKLSENLQSAEQQMQANIPQDLSSTQSNISQNFSQLKQSIQSAQGMMQSAIQAKLQAKIEKALFELLYFSKEQEKILDKKYMAYDILDTEVGIYDGIKNSINNLFKMPLIILAVGPQFSRHTAEALNKFERMFEQIKDRRNYNVQKDKQEVYTSINKMIIDLLRSQQQMQGGGGGMQSLLQQLQQMAEGQSSLNLLTQALLEQMLAQMQQGQGLTPEQRNMMNRIAADENRIKENLERVLRDFPESEKLLGNLENLKKELKEVVKKLDRGIIDKQLIEQQKRILSRLLDAQKSIHRRDYSKKREAQTPEEQKYQVPDSLRIDKEFIQVKDILKFINENYPEEYHHLIKEYLERIQK